ncbi:MAG: hypothetical protein ACYC6F_18950 [Longimicrobiales bacterium]
MSERIGCSSPIIARVLLQGRDILATAFLPKSIDKDQVVQCLHEIKEAVVACHKAAQVVVDHVDRISEALRAEGVERDRTGRAVPSLPQVPDLDALCTQYLISAKRAIKAICRLPSFFASLERADSNFDHLGQRLANILEDGDPLLNFVRSNAGDLRYLIRLRNAQEHPSQEGRLEIHNFRVMADETLSAPSWSVTGQPSAGIALEMPAGVERLVAIAEGLLIYLVDWRMESSLPFVLEHVAQEHLDPKKPIRYRLTLDPSAITGSGGGAGSGGDE